MVEFIIKWSLIIGFAVCLIQWILIKWSQYQFKRLIKDQVSLAVVFGSLGQGKSLLFSWLVNRLENTYTNFWHKKKDNNVLLTDLMDVRGKYQIPEGEASYFVDEVNLYFRGVEYAKNQKEHMGIEDFCALARHFSKKVFFSVQRTNQLWIAIRDIANIYIKVQGLYTPLFLPWKSVLKLEVYEDIKLAEEWSANMAPYQKGGFFSVFSGNDFDQAKKRLNIKNYKIFLQKRDFQNYDTKFFGALLPILNEKREKKIIPPGQIPVPNTLKDVIKQEFFTVSEKPNPGLWSKIKNWFSSKRKPKPSLPKIFKQKKQPNFLKVWWSKIKGWFKKKKR